MVCDVALDWFITYLVRHSVRTFLPRQPEVTCSAPPKWAGHRLKNLMITKANDTMTASMHQIGVVGGSQQQNNFLSQLLPAYTNNGGGSSVGNASLLGTLTQAFPALRNIPQLNALSPASPGHSSARNLGSSAGQVLFCCFSNFYRVSQNRLTFLRIFSASACLNFFSENNAKTR